MTLDYWGVFKNNSEGHEDKRKSNAFDDSLHKLIEVENLTNYLGETKIQHMRQEANKTTF